MGRRGKNCAAETIGADCVGLEREFDTLEYTKEEILSKCVLIAGTQCCDGARNECENLRTEKRTFVSPKTGLHGCEQAILTIQDSLLTNCEQLLGSSRLARPERGDFLLNLCEKWLLSVIGVASVNVLTSPRVTPQRCCRIINI